MGGGGVAPGLKTPPPKKKKKNKQTNNKNTKKRRELNVFMSNGSPGLNSFYFYLPSFWLRCIVRLFNARFLLRVSVLCGQPSLPYNFNGKKPMKIFIDTICMNPRNCKSKILVTIVIVQKLELQDWTLAWSDWFLFYRGQTCGVPAANNLQST